MMIILDAIVAAFITHYCSGEVIDLLQVTCMVTFLRTAVRASNLMTIFENSMIECEKKNKEEEE